MMASPAPYRKVLFVGDEPSMRNVLYVLLASLGYEGEVAHSTRQALAMISRESFDGVLIDLRCPYAPAEEVVSRIRKVQPSLIGRVLVITGEVQDPETMDMIERHCIAGVPRHRLKEEFCARLRKLLGVATPHPHAAS